ncbi:MipA/OmpV family protein [Rhizobium lentis]|uniref:MipA/OmpV family protein n=1 Tax=Rhizobium lentis TaxID=1138194 RepID=A0A9Q3QXT1_9HYPH|nr:MipA/OmpV family protein [Rhizobium lentis]MBX4955245.1 MipA/OmpV family protein [Rhizobium lentis]MBX4987028.1 MipA/OmpV family protein [Rhizobium lentis]MBX4998416.1 MipA/OmpV family protein [Rhizobium lentis]MBX5005472.1 MipA/OmpV family protein [Rhizobium lentis]MBX5008978.1 MipA/OmpV family protein [Rhizobium lentis]
MSASLKLTADQSRLLSIAVASLFLSTFAAQAADFGSGEQAAPAAPDPERFGPVRQALHDWHVVIGAGAVLTPKYEGSDEFEVSPFPFVSAEFFDRITIDPTGIEIKAIEKDAFRFDVNVGYDSGRDEDDADMLRGMGDIDFGVTVGGKATYTFGPANVFVSVDKTIGGSEGLLATAGASISQPLSEHLILGAEASATFADDNYMEAYFGVNSTQSSRSGHAQYKAGAGIKSVDLSASATYLINENWVVKGEQGVSFLVGDAADSPIVKEKVQAKTLLMLGYRF